MSRFFTVIMNGLYFVERIVSRRTNVTTNEILNGH